MNIREKQEQTEMELLSPYATQSIRTKGKKKPEVECGDKNLFPKGSGSDRPLQGFSPFKKIRHRYFYLQWATIIEQG